MPADSAGRCRRIGGPPESLRGFRLAAMVALPGLASPMWGQDPGPQEAASEPVEGAILGTAADWTTSQESPPRALADIPAGSRLRRDPDLESPLLVVLPEAKLAVEEWRDLWVRVTFGEHRGWVRLDAADKAHGELKGQARSADLPPHRREPGSSRDFARTLEQARSFLLEGRSREGRLGPFRLFTDCEDTSLIEYLNTVAEQVTPAYQQRYGLSTSGTDPGAVVLYAQSQSYQAFYASLSQHLGAPLPRERFVGVEVSGTVALTVEGRPRWEITNTLVHELTHVWNRRLLGSYLPRWLDEGLAEDLAMSEITSKGKLRPERISRQVQVFKRPLLSAEEVRILGGMAAVRHLAQVHRSGALAPLAELLHRDRDSFLRSEDSYPQAALFVRFLAGSSKNGLNRDFRSFLSAVAQGEPPSPQVLESLVGQDLSVLEQGFRSWLIRTDRAFELLGF